MNTRDVGDALLEKAISIEHNFPKRQQAMVIGVDTYGPGFNRLDNAVSDARAISEVLAAEYGFELIPSGTAILDHQASFEAICPIVESSLRSADSTMRWLFFFAGHGIMVDREGYLLPTNAIIGRLDTYLPLQWLLKRSLDSDCGEVLIILDACYGGRALVRYDQLSDYIPKEGFTDRIRQLVTSGNPDQPVLDGGADNHSIFTQTLLDALQGWAGIHESDGSVRFSKLLDHVVFEVPSRLRNQGISTARQQPIGGNLIGNRLKRDFVFHCTVPRLPPEIVRRTRSDDQERRRQDLARLTETCKQASQLTPLAVKIAKLHLLTEPMVGSATLITSTLRYEPAIEVRAEAAHLLGMLGEPAAINALILALDDQTTVCRAAAQALGQLGVAAAALPLLHRLYKTDVELLLDLVDAIGAVGDGGIILEALRESLKRGRLVPFVGPDFPAELTGLPDRATIAQRLAKHEGLSLSDSLAQTASESMHGGSNRYIFTEFLKRELCDQLSQPGTIHKALAELNTPFWISGTYDNLLVEALDANQIVTGEDTKYWRADRPTVVRMTGDLTTIRELVVLEQDYALLRENEGDRQLLLSYVRRELSSKIVLFLGYDPQSPDFKLLLDYVFNVHLTSVDVRVFLIWPEYGPEYQCLGHPIRYIRYDPLDFVKSLKGPSMFR